MTRKTSLENRFHHLDLLKFIAILFVIMVHLFFIPHNIYSEPSATTYINYTFKALLATCVPIFFFVNGYLLINKPFILKRHIRKTLYFLFLVTMWGAITLIGLMFIRQEHLGLGGSFAAVFTMKSGWINHLWFMFALIIIYILFPLIKTSFDNNMKIYIYCVIICISFSIIRNLLSMTAFFLQVHYPSAFYINYVVNYIDFFNPDIGDWWYSFAYFCLGGLIGAYQNQIWNYFQKYKCAFNIISLFTLCISLVSLSLWGIFYSRKTAELWNPVWDGYETIFTLINVLCMYVLSLNYKPDFSKVNFSNILSHIILIGSTHSMGIYFLHMLILEASGRYLLPYLTHKNIIVQLAHSLIVLFICAGISLLIKKIPIIRKILI